MKYIDTVDDVIIHSWRSGRKKREIIEACDLFVKRNEDSIDHFRKVIKETEDQIAVWETEEKKDPQKDYREQIKIFQTIADFFRINGRLVLIELDVNTAYKFLFIVKSEYEYRFFARRIYTLMYETNKGLVVPAGRIIKELETEVDSKYLKSYKEGHKELKRFLKKHKKELQNVRNSNEAHKFSEFEVQVESIENFSVAQSIGVIKEYHSLLGNMYDDFVMMYEGLTASLGKIAKKKRV